MEMSLGSLTGSVRVSSWLLSASTHLARSREKTLQFPGGGADGDKQQKRRIMSFTSIFSMAVHGIAIKRRVRGGPQKLRREGHYPVQNGLDAELFYPPASILTNKIAAGLNPSERNEHSTWTSYIDPHSAQPISSNFLTQRQQLECIGSFQFVFPSSFYIIITF